MTSLSAFFLPTGGKRRVDDGPHPLRPSDVVKGEPPLPVSSRVVSDRYGLVVCSPTSIARANLNPLTSGGVEPTPPNPPDGVFPTRALLSACGRFVWGAVLVVCVCVSVSGVLFSVGVCACDLLIFLQGVGGALTMVRSR